METTKKSAKLLNLQSATRIIASLFKELNLLFTCLLSPASRKPTNSLLIASDMPRSQEISKIH